ncbi:hypothetical protein ACIPSE_32385 [Streptomyces sp. NPDC090106]|uniref:hypothetical protein n=1 Tax=Streptomyces sp. NPDC090106 TaxID=3365946 RepID=UPI0038243E14
MISASRTAHSIASTAESLQSDLDRLELQKRSLERELAAVAAHLDTVRRAVHALESALTEPVAPAAQPSGSEADSDRTDRTDRTASADPGDAGDPGDHTDSGYGRLTEQILTYLSQVGDTDVRARDVATALGRATDSGTINAVRSTLDRLVGTSRVRRTGRGLYRAAPRP